MLAKKTAKNQLTLPKDVADRFPGTDYFDVTVKGQEIRLRPVRIEVGETAALLSIREKMRRLGAGEEDVAKAVRWARKRG